MDGHAAYAVGSHESNHAARRAIGHSWTPASATSLLGRRVVITGATRGLGLASATELATMGASLILAVRDEVHGAEVAGRLRDDYSVDVEVARLDLADLATVREFAARMNGPIDLLVNNAGLMWGPRRTTVDGFEGQLATNYLGHFALTGLLLPRLLEAPASRVVSVTSALHTSGRFDFDDMNFTRRYSQYAAYSRSKLAMLVFARELARRSQRAGIALSSYAAHPGYAATDLQTRGRGSVMTGVMTLGNVLFATSAQQGATPIVCAATVPGLPNGTYVGPSRWGGLRGAPGVARSSPASRDLDAARRLWDYSQEATGVEFGFGG
ncbi:oxidoreductase [Leekyejoonella antrihumi]|uniref:SDR family NAD(P)-dependent oxidoreductase n=1 Tax=Leekyejoonella antrihumi TaxID=1660198 RepID=A0A563DVI7_9MICO|nr:oxidoreductase [Leekyejoonella antrihumi]TWP34205.1 SDR family NAD(P)-dependent oxidoreductase [Leekyejoonella antrihumi]